MATPQTQRSVPDVLQNIVGNLQEIIRSEFRLAKTELKEEAAEAAVPAGTFGAGLVLGFYGIGFLLLAAVYGLSTLMAGWMAALLVGCPVYWGLGTDGFRRQETEAKGNTSWSPIPARLAEIRECALRHQESEAVRRQESAWRRLWLSRDGKWPFQTSWWIEYRTQINGRDRAHPASP